MKPLRGYITLLSILIIGAIGTAIATSLIALGPELSEYSHILTKLYQSQSLADACSEYYLAEIHHSAAFTNDKELTLNSGTCSLEIIEQEKDKREINAVGKAGSNIRKTKIGIDSISPNTIVVSWQEVPDF